MQLGRIFSLQPHPAEYRFGEEMVLHQPINIPSFRLMPLVPGLIGFPSMHSPMPLMPPLFPLRKLLVSGTSNGTDTESSCVWCH
jgi:hypothetical protein